VKRELFGLNRDMELLRLPADRQHFGNSRNGEQPAAQDEIRGAFEVRAAVAIGHERDEHDFAHDRSRRRHHGRRQLGRQRVARDLQSLRDHLPRSIKIRPPLEFHCDDGDPDLGRRAHAPHARRAIERRFDRERDERLDLGRRHAARFRDDCDRGRREIGEHVYRHARRLVATPQHEERACDHDEQPVA
jgi:hypothetical protein